MISDASKLWLENILAEADTSGEYVIVLTHIPVCSEASHASTVFWDDDEMLKLIAGHHSLKAWIAGHHHAGGLAIRNNVLHKTIKGLCEMPEATGCIISVFTDHLEIKGFGQEENYTFLFP